MKTDLENRVLVTSGVTSVSTFGISKTAETHIMVILRDTLYTDKILAPLREYSTNAWDAHRSAGKSDLPIKVVMPTNLNPTLVIRDWGPGMSEETVLYTYTQYGDSTKRDSNLEAGSFGLGCKSAYAYSDSFTVTSWHGGYKKIYSAILDESNAGIMQKLHEEPCGDETGIEVQMPVKPKDISEFEARAARLFKYFKPTPDCNIHIPSLESFKITTPYGYFDKFSYGVGWTAVMGPIPYKLDLDQIETALRDADLYTTMRKLCGVLYFDIGEVQTAASREELRYSDYTIKAVVEKISKLYEHYVEYVIKTVSDTTVNDFNRRVHISDTCSSFGIKLSKQHQKWSNSTVTLYTDADKPKTFTASNVQNSNPSVYVHSGAVVYIKDEVKAIKGYGLNDYATIITPILPDPVNFKLIREELDTFLAAAGLTGIPIANLSSVPWSRDRIYTSDNKSNKVTRIGPVNPVYRAKCFKYSPGSSDSKPSDKWEIVTRVPSKDDVFVILDKFEVVGQSWFHSQYACDLVIFKALKQDPPCIYGYKSTEKKPKTVSDCVGVHYPEWRLNWLKNVVDILGLNDLYDAYTTVKATEDTLSYSAKTNMKFIAKRLSKFLGASHPLCVVIIKYLQLKKIVEQDSSKVNLIVHIDETLKRKKNNPISITSIIAKYPLLDKLHRGWYDAIVSDSLVEEVINYIRLVDSSTIGEDPNVEYYI